MSLNIHSWAWKHTILLTTAGLALTLLLYWLTGIFLFVLIIIPPLFQFFLKKKG